MQKIFFFRERTSRWSWAGNRLSPPAKFSGESEFSIRFKIWDRDHAEIQDSNTKSASDSNKNQLIFVFES